MDFQLSTSVQAYVQLYVGEHDMARPPLKTRIEKLTSKVCSEDKRNQMLRAHSSKQGMLSGLHMRGAPVWTQYIAFSQFMMIPGSVNMY